MTTATDMPPATFPVAISLSCPGEHQWLVQGTCVAGAALLDDIEHGPFCPVCFALATEVVYHDPDEPVMPALMPVLMRMPWREQFVGAPEGILLHRDVVAELADQG